jgi:hypothetical protein
MLALSGDYFEALHFAGGKATWFNQFSSVKIARNVLLKHCLTTYGCVVQ